MYMKSRVFGNHSNTFCSIIIGHIYHTFTNISQNISAYLKRLSARDAKRQSGLLETIIDCYENFLFKFLYKCGSPCNLLHNSHTVENI